MPITVITVISDIDKKESLTLDRDFFVYERSRNRNRLSERIEYKFYLCIRLRPER